jgi:hypothetical protein
MNESFFNRVGKGMSGSLKFASALLLVAVLNTGCLTRSLWSDETHRASPHPNITLALSPNQDDVLVQYNEKQPDKIRRRSYWLFDYTTLQGGEGKPEFVRANNYPELIPLTLSHDEAMAEPTGGFVAVKDPSKRSFELQRYGVPIGHFDLPSYTVDAKPTFERVALTPLAAVGDGVIAVGAAVSVVGVYALIGYLDNAEWPDGDEFDVPHSGKHHQGGLRAVRNP